MKHLQYSIVLAGAFSLAACGGSDTNDSPDIPIDQPINTAATIGGDLSAAIDADTASVNGAITVTDPDTNESTMTALTDIATSYGTFSIATDGQWTYNLDTTNTNIIATPNGGSLSDTISVNSADDTSASVQITINGVNDAPTIGSGDGVDEASINADQTDTETGTLPISDPDTNESEWIAQSDVTSNYGSFSLASNGAWSYTLDTSNAMVSALSGQSDTLDDSLTIESVDGTMATVIITILGIDQEPIASALTKGSIGDNDSVPEINCTITVSSVSELEDELSFDMTPGETVCLAAGEYGEFDISYGGTGTSDLPITLAAAVPGEVIISGEAFVGITGEYVVLQGFVFKDGSMNSSLIQTRANSNTFCNNCRITENSFIDMDRDQDNSTKWFQIYGTNNRFDHNFVSGKRTRGALFVIERDFLTGTIDRTQIDHNYFGNRPPKEGTGYAENSDNEYEGIRIGSSSTHTSNSFAVVEHNFFEGIDGEAEVISVKAGSVTIQHNTIRNSRGAIVSRHGEGTVIDNNFIFGDGNPFSAGIRIVDANHQVTNNYLEGARYLNSNFNGGILVSNSDGSTSNGYQDVENVFVAHNTVVDSVNSINLYAGNRSTNADSVYLINNIVVDAIGDVFVNTDELPTNSVYAGNHVFGQSFSDSVSSLTGVTFQELNFVKASDGLFRPTASTPDISAVTDADMGAYTLPSQDMDGELRSDDTLAGSDESFEPQQTLSASQLRAPLTPELVGPLSYTPPQTSADIQAINLVNADFDNASLNAWTTTDASLVSDTDETFSGGASAKVQGTSGSVSQSVAVEANTNYTLSAFVKGQGQVMATVGSDTYTEDQSNSEYRFTSVSFNSGTQTSITIAGMVDQEVTNFVDIENANFDDDQANWTVNEGTGIGQVQDSDNSASGNDGSIKFTYNEADSGSPYDPYIAQTVTVEPNTDYTLSMYILLKSSDEQDASVLFGVHTGAAVVDGVFSNDSILASKNSLYNNIDEELEGDDSFRQDTITFNSGSNTSLTIFAQYQSTLGDDIRIDDLSMYSVGAPANDTEAYFDEFRLISHPSLP